MAVPISGARASYSDDPLPGLPAISFMRGFHKPTSLAEASSLKAVACLVCSSHKGLGKAAVGKDGAIRRTAQTGSMAGKITFILRGRAPPIHHGPCGTPQVSVNVFLGVHFTIGQSCPVLWDGL
ncbi:hypothetical protein XENOCAPTIV_012369, partial [Xenoophorus captivus]